MKARGGILTVLLVAGALLVAVSGVVGLASGGSSAGRMGFKNPRVAAHWESLDDSFVRCGLCPRRCVVPPGGRGYCEVRENRDGVYYTLTYGNPCAIHVDPIEKKPFYHFLPSTTAFSIATAGCNLDCKFCQNWHISQARPEELANYDLPPVELVAAAVRSGAPSIAYTYSEPTIFYEYMLECAKLAHDSGLRNVYHSNGYIQPEPLRELAVYLDAANVDLKGFTEDYYREMSNASLAPVLRSLKILKEEGVHLEITTLLVPGANDDPETLTEMCRWIVDNLGATVPVHFSRFHPQHRLKNLPPTPVERLDRAREIALREGLRYVYVGNVPGHEANSTYCPACSAELIHRIGYSVEVTAMETGRCSVCGAAVDGVWE
ncbi:MAG TPA: AmmeMemoRadiSam system radical SAM enzyme [bacterium]|nr:AmmeMemoRadiSam system radical SAM enzyme [bacterium]